MRVTKTPRNATADSEQNKKLNTSARLLVLQLALPQYWPKKDKENLRFKNRRNNMNTSHRKIYRNRECEVYVLSGEPVNRLPALLVFYGGNRLCVKFPLGKM